jgi:hypothetical protein
MDNRRSWLAIVLEEALKLGVIEAEEIVRHATPDVLATDLPSSLVASLLQAGLAGTTFNAATLVAHLGAENIAQHVPLPVIWNCIDDAAGRIIAEHPLSRRAGANEDRAALVEIGTPVIDDGAPDIEVIDD